MCGVTIIAHKQTLPISNLTTTTQVDTDSNNYYITQYFTTPRKHNHSTPEKPETNTTYTSVQTDVYSRQCQISSSTSTTSLKLPPSGKEYLCFHIYGESDQ